MTCISIKGFVVINHASFLGFRWQCGRLTVTKTRQHRVKKEIYYVANRQETGCILATGRLQRVLGSQTNAASQLRGCFLRRLRPSWKPEPSAIQQVQWMSNSICHCPRPLCCSLPEQGKRLSRSAFWDMWATKDSSAAFKFRR